MLLFVRLVQRFELGNRSSFMTQKTKVLNKSTEPWAANAKSCTMGVILSKTVQICLIHIGILSNAAIR